YSSWPPRCTPWARSAGGAVQGRIRPAWPRARADTFAVGKGPAGRGRIHHMGEAPRYSTLRDYLRVLREQRLLIIVIAAVVAGAALWLAERQQPVYEAQAAVQFTD